MCKLDHDASAEAHDPGNSFGAACLVHRLVRVVVDLVEVMLMPVQFDLSALKNTRWYELVIRFLLGGLITAATGIIGKEYGASVGGLFLAFRVIFPASATLIDKHEKEKKQSAGLEGRSRARQLVSVDAAGAAMGSVGL